MAKGHEVLEMLIPQGGWILVGQEYEGIQFLECDPITKEDYLAGFEKVDAWKIEQEAKASADKATAQAKLAALGLTSDDLKALGLQVKAKLSKSVVQIREQADDAYPDRKRNSDGTIGDARHSTRKSDHNPDPDSGIVRAIDLDADFDKQASTAAYIADQIRIAAKSDKRIAYVIFNHKIASARSLWRWRKYTGVNPTHQAHPHQFYKGW